MYSRSLISKIIDNVWEKSVETIRRIFLSVDNETQKIKIELDRMTSYDDIVINSDGIILFSVDGEVIII